MEDRQLLVKYRGGLSEVPVKAAPGHPYRLQITDGGFTLLRAISARTGLTSRLAFDTVFGEKWQAVRAIRIEDAGGTRPHAGAVLAFGVAGLAARKRLGVSLTIEMGSTDLMLETKEPLPEVRSLLGRTAGASPKLHINGQAPGGASTGSAVSSPGDSTELAGQLQTLSSLHDAGHLTTDEFAAAKRKLIHGS